MKLKILVFVLLSSISAFAQIQTKPSESGVDVKKLAQSVLAAHGGENLKKVKTMSVLGTVELASSEMMMPMTGSFAMVVEGEKGRFDLKMPVFSFTQIYDGRQIQSSMEGVYLPPVSQFGFSIIQRFEDGGVVISGDDKGKPNNFYVALPSGYTTLFEIDAKTNLVKGYKSTFAYNGTEQDTIVEVEKWRDVAGVKLPEKFSQRFSFGRMTFYLKYQAKILNIDSPVGQDVFLLKQTTR